MPHRTPERPHRTPESLDVIVVGGGVIGLSIAWRAASAGMAVAVLDRGPLGGQTSRVAAGMLAPVSELEFGPTAERVLRLGLRSAELWPAFAASLEAQTGLSVGLLATGTITVARDADEAAELDRQLALRRSVGLSGHRLLASQARASEPALAPTMRCAIESPDDHSVDPRAVLEALRSACERSGVSLRPHTPVAGPTIDRTGERVVGVTLTDGQTLAAREVILCAGPWTSRLSGLPHGWTPPVRPVKGQILRLRDPAGPGLLSRVLRYEGGYVVPRADGRYVIGATVEERGFDRTPTAGAVHELLDEAHEILPGISEWELQEVGVGLRPCTPDNAPVIGRPEAVGGLIWATGHHRNGVLLTPLTCDLVSDLLQDRTPAGEALAACSPDRFPTAPPPATRVVAAPAGAPAP